MADPDLSEFHALANPREPACRIKGVIDSLEGPEREQLIAALARTNGEINAGAIIEWIKKRGKDALNGKPLNPNHIVSHRGGRCACD